MTMREPSKPVTVHWAIKVADLISSHHVLSLGETLTTQGAHGGPCYGC